ncbi:hypothetical protein Astex_0315 [Asticcacaulis excentricus CB 48]|uniref:Lipoprotein n=1 Tax=Asticcacaulis excentricus (strain ATCC 15261 / DSM 4724 / KCTC 12464 / NCIMB 9791 / VKM B-1370 / CB 48) TaxID=573065 RepID=E8RPN6_ASTEC|nr:hypothetical protein Astex_0315 [Asticcacaulis excentricus CB 48]
MTSWNARALAALVTICPMVGSCGFKSVDYCDDMNGPTTALYGSRTFVERDLKSPSTARFPSQGDAQVRVIKIAQCEYSVVSYVESENLLGAMVRTNYIARVEVDQKTGVTTLRSMVY